MAPGAKAQTLKQAKASYTSRGRPSLSEKQQRQLQRDLILDQRAERAREQERRRAEAAKKRADKEKKDKAERDRLQQGSQRRCDRFGHVSSQYHLGAFLNVGGKRKAPVVEEPVLEEIVAEAPKLEEVPEEDFADDGIDDGMLLEALKGTPIPRRRGDECDAAVSTYAVLMPSPPKPKPPLPTCKQAPPNFRNVPLVLTDNEMDSLWENLECSTPIASRSPPQTKTSAVLMPPPVRLRPPPNRPDRKTPEVRSTLIPIGEGDSASFWNGANSKTPVDGPSGHQPKASGRLMQPPPRPNNTSNMRLQVPWHQSNACNNVSEIDMSSIWDDLDSSTQIARELDVDSVPDNQRVRANSFGSDSFDLTTEEINMLDPQKSPSPVKISQPIPMPPLPMPVTAQASLDQMSRALNSGIVKSVKRPPAIRGPFRAASSMYCSPDLGFTMTQLENYIDDDIQLTQAAPAG